LKTFTAFGVFGTSVLTALTAQNTRGVQAISPVSADFVGQQLDSVLDDIGATAIKTGMLFNAEIIDIVADRLRKHGETPLVIDPVMVSSSGHRLLDASAVSALAGNLLPLSTLVTPNTLEAEVLVEFAGKSLKIDSVEAMKEGARTIYSAFNLKGYVLLKGGHLPVDSVSEEGPDSKTVRLPGPEPLATGGPAQSVVDLLYDGQSFILYPKPYHRIRNLHGTGCTLSAAITAGLAQGRTVPGAVENALVYLNQAIASKVPFSVGTGAHGPVNHLHSISAPSAAAPSDAQELVDRFIASCSQEWSSFVDHEFIRKIADGTLPEESFRHYLTQDYVYLIHFARAHALAAYKEHHMADIAHAAHLVLSIARETKVHVSYCAEWGISLEELESTVEAVPNLSYSRFFLEKGISGDRLDLRVALLPCFEGYRQIGKRLFEDPNTKRRGNPYWNWICSYADNEYQESCRENSQLLLRLYRELVPDSNKARWKQLCDTFRQATILEARFWDMGLYLQH
jgi:thiaminase II